MSSNTLTFDESPTPRRPTIDDLGGGAKQNATSPPDPVRQATAEDFNQATKQIAAVGRVIPLATVFVTISAGVPTVSGVLAPGSSVTTGSFTLTDNGAGDTTISWAASLLPTRSVGAKAFQTDDTEIDRIRAFYGTASVPVANSPAVRVKTKLGATGTDCNFGVDIL
jgi:hypothetical protein